ncbi:MAG TPA: methyltransferase domain-containing protein [Steroidobacteraceae bacterium]|nr:methyltransferase domain-containing protein [Steroidobacteraceae bacterium]
MKLRVKALLAGLATYVPGYDYRHGTGGTDSARYCYSVWLRHLVLAQRAGALPAIPRDVAELGPGDSIGIGLMALLTGAESYSALDVVPYGNLGQNLAIFDELLALLRARAPIPGESDFPGMKPDVADLAFPAALLEAGLEAALSEERVRSIRWSVANVSAPESRIRYRAPWTSPAVLESASVDYLFSQAVLEHIDDLDTVYAAMRRWLRPGGVMTHQVDYRSHGKADTWDGHWTYSNAAWRLVVGRRPYLLNRVTHSGQMRRLAAAGFEVLGETVYRAPSHVRRAALAPHLRDIPDDDLTACGAFVVARAPRSGAMS